MLRLLLLTLVLLPQPAQAQTRFLTDEELLLVEEALTLLNMTPEDPGFDKLVLEDDWRLPVVERTLRRPLAATDVAWGWAEQSRQEPAAILVAAGRELGLEVALPEPDSATWPATRALELLGEATADLTPAECDILIRWAYAELISSESHDGLFSPPEQPQDPEQMLALAARVRRAAAFEAGVRLLQALPALLELEPGSLPPGVRVGSPGDDLHDLRTDPPILLIEPGGDDRYLAPARATPEHPVALVVDLEGSDTYGAGESLSSGAALLGFALLWDRGAGDDRYLGGHLSQGCGLLGVGLLVDEGGSDLYRVRDTGQGAGAWGAGVLLDLGEGNDLFHADLFGQGFGYVGGLGLLRNEAGQDVYEAGGVHLHYPLFNDRYQSLSQGFSIGMRPHASGGVGLLIDDAGNDRYACDIYGQGASYWFAYGALVDRDGNDTYTLGQYGQGGGIHLAVGCLLDLAGQDLYYNMHGVGTGGAHDFAVGILVDRAGDDYYAGSGGTMGGALTNSFAMLLDGAGDDGYSAVKVSHAEGGGRPARGMGSIGLLLDGSGQDLHGTRELNATSWTKESYGAGIDRPDPPPAADPPAPATQLSREEALARVRRDAWLEAEGRYDLAQLWEVASRWAVGEMASVVPVALEEFVGLGSPALAHALSRVGTPQGLEARAVQHVLEAFGEEAVAPLQELLSSEEERRRSTAASLLADLQATAAIPDILPLLDAPGTRRGALDALGRMGDATVWPRVASCLEDETERTRVAAIRCLQKLRAVAAVPQLVARLSPPEPFTVRFAAEDVLVSLGEEASHALQSVAREGAELHARRHAIRALGRIRDAQVLPLLAELAGDPDWRLRYEAVGALLRFLEAEGAPRDEALGVLRERAGVEPHPQVQARLREVPTG